MRGAAGSLHHTPCSLTLTPLLLICPTARTVRRGPQKDGPGLATGGHSWALQSLCWSKVLRGGIAWENKDGYLDLICMLPTGSCYVYGHHLRSSCKISGKEQDSVCLLEEFCTFIPTPVSRWKRKDVVFTGVPKEEFLALLTLFCATSSVATFSLCCRPWLTLELPPIIKTHEHRGVSHKEYRKPVCTGPWISPLTISGSWLVEEPFIFAKACLNNFIATIFFSRLWDSISKHLVAD